MPAEAIDTTGAGDVVTGVLTAALSNSGFSPQAAADALAPAIDGRRARHGGLGRARLAAGGRSRHDEPRRAARAPAAEDPRAERMRELRDALRSYYGRPRNEPHQAPLDELVLTVLSQNTNDRNRDVAYARLRDRFPDWEAVARAPDAQIEEAIRPGGISKVKAGRIKAMLGAIEAERGSLDLGFLADAPREEALDFLEGLPGVGRKTAACVLLFSFDRPELPVDTHVYRVASRLGPDPPAGLRSRRRTTCCSPPRTRRRCTRCT